VTAGAFAEGALDVDWAIGAGTVGAGIAGPMGVGFASMAIRLVGRDAFAAGRAASARAVASPRAGVLVRTGAGADFAAGASLPTT